MLSKMIQKNPFRLQSCKVFAKFANFAYFAFETQRMQTLQTLHAKNANFAFFAFTTAKSANFAFFAFTTANFANFAFFAFQTKTFQEEVLERCACTSLHLCIDSSLFLFRCFGAEILPFLAPLRCGVLL